MEEADIQIGYERRRSIAQLLVLVAIVVLGVVSKSVTVDAALKPLFAEARRRRSIYSQRRLQEIVPRPGIDLTGDHSPPTTLVHREEKEHTTSSLPETRPQVNPYGRQPIPLGGPRQRRQPATFNTSHRSFPVSSQHIVKDQANTRTRNSMPSPIDSVIPKRISRDRHSPLIKAEYTRDGTQIERPSPLATPFRDCDRPWTISSCEFTAILADR